MILFYVLEQDLEIHLAVANGPMLIPAPVIVMKMELFDKRAKDAQPVFHVCFREGAHVAGVKTEAHLFCIQSLNQSKEHPGGSFIDILEHQGRARALEALNQGRPRFKGGLKPLVLGFIVSFSIIACVADHRHGLKYGDEVECFF